MKNCQTLVWVGLLCAVGCDTQLSQPVVETRKAPPAVADEQRDENRVITENTERVIGGLKVVIPAGWEQKSEFDRTILEGEFRLAGASGQARLTLSRARGGREENIDRWRKQIARGADDPEATETQVEAAGKDATVFEAHGAFTDMFSRSPQSGWMIFGIVIPIESQYHYFVKVTGPRETVESHREEVLKFVSTARFEN